MTQTLEEAEFAQSRADFINKMSMSLKEANETDYGLDVLQATDFIDAEQFQEYKAKAQGMLRLLMGIVKTSKE